MIIIALLFHFLKKDLLFAQNIILDSGTALLLATSHEGAVAPALKRFFFASILHNICVKRVR